MFTKLSRYVWIALLAVLFGAAFNTGRALAADRVGYAPQRGVHVRVGPSVGSALSRPNPLPCGTTFTVDDATTSEASPDRHTWMKAKSIGGVAVTGTEWIAVDVTASTMPNCANAASASLPQDFAAAGTVRSASPAGYVKPWSWNVSFAGLPAGATVSVGQIKVTSVVSFTAWAGESFWYQGATTPNPQFLAAGNIYTLVAGPGSNTTWKSAVSQSAVMTFANCKNGLGTPNRWGFGHCWSQQVGRWAPGHEIGEFTVPRGATGADLTIQVQLESANCRGNGIDSNGGVFTGDDGSQVVVLPDVVVTLTVKPGVLYKIGELGGCGN